MSKNAWRPTASIKALRQRAALLAQIRTFFSQRGVLETEVPVLSQRATSDPHIESISTQCSGETAYLATSPELGLKRLLAAGLGDCYYLGKAFRQGESGGRHNPEFSMLEWYRCGWDDRQLMAEVTELLSAILATDQVQSLSYRELFLRELQLDPHSASNAELVSCVAREMELSFTPRERNECLDLLMSHRLEASMNEGITLIYDFPAEQAALAKVLNDQQGTPVARRFEAYAGGLELANGYWELTDSKEQLRRFEKDLAYRRDHLRPLQPFDERLVSALAEGMPDCAGVALGVDRLLMLAAGYDSIDKVIAFPFSRA
ncbi:EF-P lysine aminoacylase EpmA [Microbulbifer sp. OS29]|uniref:EF-P lysine aminoacylase EpmA n=1 Tax=Microbulbifer okhotskensis TaxID=2926617 RepID=A0A9X2EN18_9GAMM|nr:EF-P lysine aminoacylase EpmA [Microbulbifer okhotskensis]MCO1334130.1 EF-P lysine aminoacylase EpmA [Microbulbifer okhotskensis]